MGLNPPNSLNESSPVLLSGASGMLGAAIASALLQPASPQQASTLLKLVRRQPANAHELYWNPETGEMPEKQRLEGASVAIHLSGANVSTRRWTAAYKQEMTASRVVSTNTLSRVLAALSNPPKVLVCASATGLYGDRGSEILDENSAPGSGFFSQLCAAWEAASRPAEDVGIRVVHLRFGVVIGKGGGILARLAPLFKLGLGGPLGNGSQWMSWISKTDVVAAVLFAVGNPALSGAFNCVAPQPVTNAEFTRDFAHAVHRPAFLAAPAFALRLAFGEMANEALLASTRAIPKRLLAAGFSFTHPTLPEALADALSDTVATKG